MFITAIITPLLITQTTDLIYSEQKNDPWPLSAERYEENGAADDGHGAAHGGDEGQSLQVAQVSRRVHVLQRDTRTEGALSMDMDL